MIIIIISASVPALAASSNDINLSLIYHRITLDPKMRDAYTITVEDFESDIKYLLSKGYTFCTASEYDTKIKSGDKSKKYVAITFDDGYSSDYWFVLPVLKKYNVKATFFIVGSLINTPNYMNMHQITALSKSPHAEIGSHTYALHRLSATDLENVYKNQSDKTIADYRKNSALLKDITGKNIKAVAYPYGVYTNDINKSLNSEGIITFSSNEKPTTSSVTPYPRINRPHDLSVSDIISRHTPKITNQAIPSINTRDKITNIPSRNGITNIPSRYSIPNLPR